MATLQRLFNEKSSPQKPPQVTSSTPHFLGKREREREGGKERGRGREGGRERGRGREGGNDLLLLFYFKMAACLLLLREA